MAAPISKIAVIGSGVMGSGIAAHAANAGVPILLLDVVPKGAKDRNVLARNALERMRKSESSPFMLPANSDLITIGNLEDDLTKIKDADWIIEAVLEDVKVKSDLYASVDAMRKQGCIVSSNTSTITLNALLQGQSAAFRSDFLIAHFFNPPRQMRLLEMVTGAETRASAADHVRDFCDRRLGKGVIHCKDTPGFIANRLGIFFLQAAINAAFEFGVTVEEADAVFSKPFGMPNTGIFGLLDLIGVDLIPHIAESFMATLPADDVYRTINVEHPLVTKMIAGGFTGRKGGGGFYRMIRTEAGKIMEAIDLRSGDYRPSQKTKLATVENAGDDLRVICEAPDKIGRFAWQALSQVLTYAASLVPQIADDIVAIDTGMRLGFNWRWGPFELIDKLGAAWFAERLRAEGRVVPPLLAHAAKQSFYGMEGSRQTFMSTQGTFMPVEHPEGILLLADIKRGSTPLQKNGAASLWDIGDGIACLEFHTKLNIVNTELLRMVKRAINFVRDSGDRFKAIVIHNEANVFSAGADLGLMQAALHVDDDTTLEGFIRLGRDAYQAVRFAPFPIVAAPAGLALGGGCELTLHCAAVQSYAEAGMGLVEAGVGLIPCWGGCAQMLGRALVAGGYANASSVGQVFETIILAKTAKTALEAKMLGYLRPTDGITMNRERLLHDAKRRALELVKDYHPPIPWALPLPGGAGRAVLDIALEGLKTLGKLAPHDMTVGSTLASVLSGGEVGAATSVTEAHLLDLECEAFLALARTPETQARIDHMLKIGKPLRN